MNESLKWNWSLLLVATKINFNGILSWRDAIYDDDDDSCQVIDESRD